MVFAFVVLCLFFIPAKSSFSFPFSKVHFITLLSFLQIFSDRGGGGGLQRPENNRQSYG